MSLILNIDTSGPGALLSIARDGVLLASRNSESQKDHAAFLQPAIAGMITELALDIKALTAIAISAGPGSYTGLRVGMASAKGLCYALGIPLININSLEIMAASMAPACEKGSLLCPMIDARRMEVFTALFTPELEPFLDTTAMILDEHSFAVYLENHIINFSGSGAAKWQLLCKHPNARFLPAENDPYYMIQLAEKRFLAKNFSQLVDSEPYYGKEFYSTKTL